MAQIRCIAFVALLTAGVPAVQGEHLTARFFTSYGSPLEFAAMRFSPQGDRLAIAIDRNRISLIDAKTGEVSRDVSFSVHRLEFATSGGHLLGVGVDAVKFIDVGTGGQSVVNWEVPPGFVGLNLKQQSGKIVIEAVAPGGPAADSGRLHGGDEIVAVVRQGNATSVLGKTVAETTALVQGPAGTSVTIRAIPRGELQPIDVKLTRAMRTMQGGTAEFRRANAAASPRACSFWSGDAVVVMGVDDGRVYSALRPVDVDPFGLDAISPTGELLALAARLKEP